MPTILKAVVTFSDLRRVRWWATIVSCIQGMHTKMGEWVCVTTFTLDPTTVMLRGAKGPNALVCSSSGEAYSTGDESNRSFWRPK